MRSFWCILVMISVLVMSVDGAADSVTKGHAHGGDAAHLLDGSDDHQTSSSEAEADVDHCERCCHGHTASVTATVAAAITPYSKSEHARSRFVYVRNFAQAPPTPPPNA